MLPSDKTILPKLLTIFLSSSRCIYKNLAFEEWVFKNHNIEEKGDVLIIWRNTPSVVIGKYQNPWLETNVIYCIKNGIKIARRMSGGGAVYHDLGNINISILTTQERHSRKTNLQHLATQLNSDLPLLSTSKIIVNSRDDLIMEPEGSKISGTAARISHGKAYHHFTLLIDANMEKMRYSLQSPLKGKITTTATNSVPANSVSCIIQKMSIEYPSFESLLEVVYGGILKSFSSQYVKNTVVEWNNFDKDDDDLTELENLLKNEEWIFEETPKFTIELSNKRKEKFDTVYVENGKIQKSTNSDFSIGQSFYHAWLLFQL